VFKILHPLHYAKRRIKRAIIPRPIRRATWIVGGVAHPVSRVRYSVRRGVIRTVDKAITPKRRRRRKASQVTTSTPARRDTSSRILQQRQKATQLLGAVTNLLQDPNLPPAYRDAYVGLLRQCEESNLAVERLADLLERHPPPAELKAIMGILRQLEKTNEVLESGIDLAHHGDDPARRARAEALTEELHALRLDRWS
jgi:hypothetical protein